jgi:DNA-binding NarL/FixJ family response regulator
VVDDDAEFRAAVREVLERAGFVVREAPDGEQALATAQASRPSLVVLDVCLPGISGYEVLRALQDTVSADLPVVFMSGERTDKNDLISAMLLGADDYLIKPFDPDELLARIRRSLARPANRHGGASQQPPSPLMSLTPRELEVLELLADGLNQTDIAARLVLSSRTVGTHIQHILTKLDVHSRAQAVAVALRDGLEGRDVIAHVDTLQNAVAALEPENTVLRHQLAMLARMVTSVLARMVTSCWV